ncbi:hypothetical protein GQX74_008748 [Glossina fuscipes]|nr:hypothetical protein GQX74_008748 [Glossina fuscipes]
MSSTQDMLVLLAESLYWSSFPFALTITAGDLIVSQFFVNSTPNFNLYQLEAEDDDILIKFVIHRRRLINAIEIIITGNVSTHGKAINELLLLAAINECVRLSCELPVIQSGNNNNNNNTNNNSNN